MNNVRFAKGGSNDLFNAALQVEVENRRLSIEASDDEYSLVVVLHLDGVMVLPMIGTITSEQMCIAMQWVHTGDVDVLVDLYNSTCRGK